MRGVQNIWEYYKSDGIHWSPLTPFIILIEVKVEFLGGRRVMSGCPAHPAMSFLEFYHAAFVLAVVSVVGVWQEMGTQFSQSAGYSEGIRWVF